MASFSERYSAARLADTRARAGIPPAADTRVTSFCDEYAAHHIGARDAHEREQRAGQSSPLEGPKATTAVHPPRTDIWNPVDLRASTASPLTARMRANLVARFPAAEIQANAGLAFNRAAEMAQAGLSKSYRAKIAAAWRDFNAFLNAARLPDGRITFAGLTRFYLYRIENMGLEPKGLHGWRSAFDNYTRAYGIQWSLTPAEESFLKDMVNGLIRTYKGQNARQPRRPFRLGDLKALVGLLENEPTEELASQVLQCGVAYYGALRTGEHTEGHLLFEHVEFQRKGAGPLTRETVTGVTIKIPDSKTGKLDALPQQTHFARVEGDADMVLRLWDHVQLYQRPGGGKEALFTRFDRDGRRTHEPVSYQMFVNSVRTLLVRAGVAGAGEVTSHSFRQGRAMDLHANGVPLETIRIVGRWKSDAVFTYLGSGPEIISSLAGVKEVVLMTTGPGPGAVTSRALAPQTPEPTGAATAPRQPQREASAPLSHVAAQALGAGATVTTSWGYVGVIMGPFRTCEGYHHGQGI